MKGNAPPGDPQLTLNRKYVPGCGDDPSMVDPTMSPLSFELLESGKVLSQHRQGFWHLVRTHTYTLNSRYSTGEKHMKFFGIFLWF